MSDNPFADQGRIGIRLDKSEYEVALAGNTIIFIYLRNQGLEDDRFTLGIGGVPAAWVSSSQPVVSLSPGEEKQTDLTIQVPASGEVEIGERVLTIRAASKQRPDQYSEVKVKLVIQTIAILSQVAIEVDSAQISVAPGSSTTFTLQVTNNGQVTETLRLYLDGIPTGWVSTPFPIIQVEPGERKEIPVTISPPRAPESRAGRHPITIRLVSQENLGQASTQEGILTIGAFVQFHSELLPTPPIEASQNAQINVTNQGNINEAFRINWQSEEDLLAFELWQQDGEETYFKEVQEHAMKVESGKQETAYFRAGLRKRLLVGGTKLYPFQVQVSSSGDEVIAHNGEVREQGLVPVWVIPLVLVLCVSLVCLGVFIYNWLQDEAPSVAEDESWARIQQAGVLRVATSADYPPFSYHNQDFVIDGFDPALVREIGTRLGIRVEISDYAFEGLGATLQIGQADVAIAAISITPEREAHFDFSNIYYVGQDGILARANYEIEGITNPNQLAGKRVGVQQFSVYQAWAEDVLVAGGLIAQNQLFVYSKPEHAIDDLKHERIDLVVMDLQPATLALSYGDLKLVGQGLNQQRLAIALPKGANALRDKVNQALLTLQNEGRITQLAQTYLGLRPEDIIPPPTPEPTPEITSTPLPTATQDTTPAPCVDAMEFVRDLNYDDEDLGNFPMVDPGEAFQKGWQIRNSGSCTWNSTYFIQYTDGNDPAAQMGGQPTAIRGAVEPGQTYDMYVDLVAPEMAGKYVGYWQMYNAENKAFGQTVWVAIQVRVTDPEAPTATVTPETTPTPTEEQPIEPTATEVPPEPTEEPGADLRDTIWVLEGYLVDMEDEELSEPTPDVDLELIFMEDSSLEGNAGCNNFSGRYVTDGLAIALQDIIATQTDCDQPEGIMEQEDIFLTRLERAEEYRINEDGKLEIIRYVVENDGRVEKIILLFYDQRIGPE